MIMVKSRYQLDDILEDAFDNYAISKDKSYLNFNNLDISHLTKLDMLFSFINVEDEIDISEWDVSNVTDLSYMFRYSNISLVSLDKWDVSNVETMSFMFYETKFKDKINFFNKWIPTSLKKQYNVFKYDNTIINNDNNGNNIELPYWYNLSNEEIRLYIAKQEKEQLMLKNPILSNQTYNKKINKI